MILKHPDYSGAVHEPLLAHLRQAAGGQPAVLPVPHHPRHQRLLRAQGRRGHHGGWLVNGRVIGFGDSGYDYTF